MEEARASWNTRYATPEGFVCQLTLRGESGREVLQKGEAALSWLRERGCQAVSGGSHRPAEPLEHGPEWCPIHQVEMKRRDANGQSWYSHKAPQGGWCKGKPKAGQDEAIGAVLPGGGR